MAEHSTAEKYRYITRTPGVRSGRAVVEGTRFGVHDVVSYHLLGATVEEIAKSFPDLSRAQIYECLAYFEHHKVGLTPLALEQSER